MDDQPKLTTIGKVVAVYQICAGAVGVFACCGPLQEQIAHRAMVNVFIVTMLLAVALSSILAGVLLLRRSRGGVQLTFLVQILQLPVLLLKGVHFHIFLLFCLALGMGKTGEVLLNYYRGARILSLAGPVPLEFAGVNLLALAVILLLPRLLKKT